MNMKIMALILLCGLVSLCYADGAKCNVDNRNRRGNEMQNTCCMYATAGKSPLDYGGAPRKAKCEYAECTQIFDGYFDGGDVRWILTRIKIDPVMAKAIDEKKYFWFIIDYCNGKIIKACELDKSDDCRLYKAP